MVVSHLIMHGLFFAVIMDGYLLLVMGLASPRVWGYNDYPDVIKNKIPPQTKREKLLAAIIGIPWFIFVLGFPVFSTYALKSKLGGEIPFWIAFLNVFVLYLFSVYSFLAPGVNFDSSIRSQSAGLLVSVPSGIRRIPS